MIGFVAGQIRMKVGKLPCHACRLPHVGHDHEMGAEQPPVGTEAVKLGGLLGRLARHHGPDGPDWPWSPSPRQAHYRAFVPPAIVVGHLRRYSPQTTIASRVVRTSGIAARRRRPAAPASDPPSPFAPPATAPRDRCTSRPYVVESTPDHQNRSAGKGGSRLFTAYPHGDMRDFRP